MITLQRVYNSYDPLTSQLLVDVTQEFVPDNDPQATPEVIASWTIMVHLPVDSSGQVTQDASLIESLVQERIQQRLAPFTQQTSQIPLGGVVNPQAIYALTATAEVDSLPLGSFYVKLTADPDSETAPASGMFTRSIMQLITTRTNLSRPYNVAYDQFETLDNGNIVASGGLTLVESAGVATVQAGPFAITAANDNTDTLPVDSWVYSVAPGYVDNQLPDAWAQGYDFYQVYIEHDALEIVGTATAIFSY
jgi:hypothetical protein